MVSLTYGHGFFSDCDDKTSWNVTRHSMDAAHTTIEVMSGDYFKIKGVFDEGATNEYSYYQYNMTNISSDIYTKFLCRYKTSELANGARAKIALVFTSGSQTVLDYCYSTTWDVVVTDITAGKTIDYIQFWVDDDGTDGTFYTYYDFALLHKGTFTLPNTAYGMNFAPAPRYAYLGIPSKVTDTTQNLGSESATVNIGCDLDQVTDTLTWKRTGDTIDGEVFLDIAHNSSSEPWQWLDTGSHQFKVTVDPKFDWSNLGGATGRRLDLLLREYSLADKSGETYAERFGIGL